MWTYILRRLLLIPVTLVILSILTFALVRFIPGDIVAARLHEHYVEEEVVNEIKAELGLDKPIVEQYGIWVGQIVQGDFGDSLESGQPIGDELGRRFPISLQLLVMVMIIQLLAGITFGILGAVMQNRWPDYLVRLVSISLLALPNFWLATLAIILPLYFFTWSPPIGYVDLWDDPWRNLQQMWIPAVITGLSSSAIVMRITRSQMLEVLRSDFIRTARSKGLSSQSVVFVHALRNALIPIVTIAGLSFAAGLTGLVIMEEIFAIPGIGSYSVRALRLRDYQVVHAVVLLAGIAFTVVNLLVDLSYGFLDPRIRVR